MEQKKPSWPKVFAHLADDLGRFETSSALLNGEGVDLLGQDDESGLGGFTDLLEDVLELVEVDGGVVAHDRDGGDFLESAVVGGLGLGAGVEELADGLVGGAGDLELVELLVVLEGEHLADGHHVGGQGSGLVGADDGGAAESLDGGQRPSKTEIRTR